MQCSSFLPITVENRLCWSLDVWPWREAEVLPSAYDSIPRLFQADINATNACTVDDSKGGYHNRNTCTFSNSQAAIKTPDKF